MTLLLKMGLIIEHKFGPKFRKHPSYLSARTPTSSMKSGATIIDNRKVHKVSSVQECHNSPLTLSEA